MGIPCIPTLMKIWALIPLWWNALLQLCWNWSLYSVYTKVASNKYSGLGSVYQGWQNEILKLQWKHKSLCWNFFVANMMKCVCLCLWGCTAKGPYRAPALNQMNKKLIYKSNLKITIHQNTWQSPRPPHTRSLLHTLSSHTRKQLLHNLI